MKELKAYLEIEYGYLGGGAIYDNVSQLYVKMPENLFQSLLLVVQQHFNGIFETFSVSPIPTSIHVMERSYEQSNHGDNC